MPNVYVFISTIFGYIIQNSDIRNTISQNSAVHKNV